MMTIHPDSAWLHNVLRNVHNPEWRHDNLDDIKAHLHYYFPHTDYVIDAVVVLFACFEDMMGIGNYNKLVDLYTLGITAFDDGIPPIPFGMIYEESIQKTITEQYLKEYFTLKLHLARALMALRRIDATKGVIYQLLAFINRIDYIDQLETYCLLLEFTHFDHIELNFDLVTTTTKLVQEKIHNYPLKIKAYIAIAHYYYAQSDTANMKKVFDILMRRILPGAGINPYELNKIAAEQNLYMAVIHRELGEYDAAAKKLDFASTQYSRINNYVQNMIVLYEKALLFSANHELEVAHSWIDLAYAELDQLEEPHDYYRAMLDHGKGLIYFAESKFDHALTYFQRVLKIWEKHQHIYHMALATNAIGATNIRLNRPDEALELFERARDLCTPIKEKAHVSQLLKVIEENIGSARS